MEKGPEFDFSTPRDQQKFEKLSKKEQFNFVEKAEKESVIIKNLITVGVVSNFDDASEILNKNQELSNLSLPELTLELEQIINQKEKLDKINNEREEIKNKVEHWEKEFIGLKDNLGRDIAEDLAQKIMGSNYDKIKNNINFSLKEIKVLQDEIDKHVEKTTEERRLEKKGWSRSDYMDVLGPLENKKRLLEDEIIEKRKELREMIKVNFPNDQDRLIVATHIEGSPLSHGTVCGCGCPSDPKLYLSKMKELGLDKFISSLNENKQIDYNDYYDKFKNVKKLYMMGDGYSNVYAIKPEVIDEVAENFILKNKNVLNKKNTERFETLQQGMNNFNQKLQDTITPKEELEKKIKGSSILIRNRISVEKVEKEIPWAIEMLAKNYPEKVKVDLKNKIVALLSGNQSHYYGSGGSEYGVTATVIRDNPTNKIEKYYKWRDAYSPAKDNRQYYFNDLEITNIKDNSVEIRLINSDPDHKFEMREIIILEKSNSVIKKEEILSKEEQKEWLQKYYEAKRTILKKNLINATMPGYIEYTFSKGQMPYGATMNKTVQYDQPEIVDEYFDENIRVGVVIIKTQIDHAINQGKQFAWRGYSVNKEGKFDIIWQDNAYEIQLRQGNGIEMKAMDLIRLVDKS